MDVRVEIRGIRELNAAFKAVDRELPQKLKGRFLAIAEKVSGIARGKLPSRSGRAAGSIKARGTTRGASIAFGGQAAEYMPWLEFGGRVGRNRSISRPLTPKGLYVYAAIAESNDEIAEQSEDAVNDVARQAGFETRKGL